MNKHYLIFLLLLTYSCKNERLNDSNEYESPPPPIVSVTEVNDSLVYSIIDFPSISKGRSFTINSREINLIDSLLVVCIKKHNDVLIGEENIENESIELDHYKRQYVPFKNEKGEKEVYINCFCVMPKGDRWKSELIIFEDGGKCSFTVTINLSKRECYSVFLNGEA